MSAKEPLPEPSNPLGIDGLEFVEYATSQPQQFGALLQKMGFAAVARHRSREVMLYRQGAMNLIVNAHQATSALPVVSAFALRVRDAAFAHCHSLDMEDALPPGTDCNTVNSDSDPDEKFNVSESKLQDVVTAVCSPAGTPARLGYHRLCPAPCQALNHCTAGTVGASCAQDSDCDSPTGAGNGHCGPGDDWTQEIGCLSCLVESATEAAIADKYGMVGAGVSPEAAKCQDLIGDSLTMLSQAFDGVTVDCQKRTDAGKLGLVFCQNNQCTGPPQRRGQSCAKDDDCIDPSARLCKYADINGARAAIEQKIADKLLAGCSPAAISELDTCGADLPSLTTCIVDNARVVADTLSDAQYPEGAGRTP